MKFMMIVYAALTLMVSLNVNASELTNGLREFGREAREIGRRPYPQPNPGGYGRSYLSNTPLYCRGGNQGLCSTYIQWRVEQNYGRHEQGVITVYSPTSQIPSERSEKLFACGTQGSQEANWIRTNDTYVFRIYRSNECRVQGYYGRPEAEIIVRR